ncbi:YkgJ family cysteine cluster protein [uncultured Paludibaculum sp.]|uniref:YkgJ family cysteine cluster protein n=1 Tax=uncultured Paludibaculum sp. TaxID=1765020 RepID=UPI002AAB9441|nr:YkgJ family cysteine cluster protein [uncultured Paludibaculum sp.]
MSRLHLIQEEVRMRVNEITSAHRDWPCRKGCDECCRRLASIPRVSLAEWQAISDAIEALPAETAESARQRIRDTVGARRPVVCPLLDTRSGSCLIYEARPVACRTYGFYAERERVLGCSRIEAISHQSQDVIWGHHLALEGQLGTLGSARELPDWLAAGSSDSPSVREDQAP